MRIVLRSFQTGDFLLMAGEWTPEITKAQVFADTDAAIRAARELGEREVELWRVSKRGKALFGTRVQLGR